MRGSDFKLKLFRHIGDTIYAFRFKNKTYFIIYYYSMGKYILSADLYSPTPIYNDVLNIFRKYIRTGHGPTNKDDIINEMIACIEYNVLRPMFEDILFIVENYLPYD